MNDDIFTAQIPPFPGQIRRYGRFRTIKLSEKQKKWLVENFPIFENKRLMVASGLTHSTLHRFANELQLKKSAEGLLAIKRRQAAHVKKLCEENGWYDYLRRRGMTKECLDVLKRWIEANGNNLVQIQRNNPERWKEIHGRAVEKRKQSIKEDKKRVSLGLPPKTKMRQMHYGVMTKSQLAYRYSALRRGYLVGDPFSSERWMIFYDGETTRSERFESNAGKAGFVILPNDYEVKANHDFYITGT